MAVSIHRSGCQNQFRTLCALHPNPRQTPGNENSWAQPVQPVRHLTTTTPLLNKRRRILPLRHLPESAPAPPPYPYENPHKLFKQHLTGLYGGSIIKFGNIVSEKNKIKTRRFWLPNALHKRLYSLALGRHIRIKLQARVLRTVEKAGGIDEYLLGTKPQRVKELGEEGWRLRWLILQTLRAQGSPRVLADPLLRKEIELGDELRALKETQALVDADVPLELAQEMEEAEVDERIQQRLDEDRLMREEVDVALPSVWQRVGSVLYAPIEWSRGVFRRR